MHLYQSGFSRETETEPVGAIYTYINACIYIQTYTCVHPYTHIHIHTYKEIYISAYVTVEAGQSRICRAGQQAGICPSGADAAVLRQNCFLRESSVLLLRPSDWLGELPSPTLEDHPFTQGQRVGDVKSPTKYLPSSTSIRVLQPSQGDM